MTADSLYHYYQKEGRKKLKEILGLKNIMAVPRLLKIVVNIGLGEALVNKNVLETASRQLAVITGQKPIVTFARRDISSFKLRKGDAVGLKVTLRGRRMFDFYEKLVKVVLPRLRDFRGLSEKSIDKEGNFTLGFSEQIVFPELDYKEIDKIRGLEVTLVTNCRNRETTKKFLAFLGMPFKGLK